jgi:Na+/melibiose symporter-like transporter
MQSSVTKCGLAIMTNDPKQRGLYGTFDSIFQGVGGALLPFIAGTLLYKKYSIFNEAGELLTNGYSSPELWQTVVFIFAPISIALTVVAIIGISGKDVKSIYGAGSIDRFKFKDFIDVLKNNKAISMLIIAASTDKLAYATRTLTSAFFFIAILLNGELDGTVMIFAGAPAFFLLFAAFRYSAKVGMKKMLIWSSWAAAILSILAVVLVPILAPASATTLNSAVVAIIMVVYCLQYMASFVSTAIVQPMISDCTDYEFYTNGRFIPSIKGNVFAFVDKLMSAFAGLILGGAMLVAGYGFQLNLDNPAGGVGDSAITDPKFYWAILFCVFIMPLLGHIATLIAMKWYPIDAKMYSEMQVFIAKERKDYNDRGCDNAAL